MSIEATSVHPSAPPIEESLEKKQYPHTGLHRMFLVATTGLAVASLVPGARQVSSLALRSVAFFSSSALCADSWDQLDAVDRILSVAKIGVVALGFVGVVLSRPAVFVAALTSEVGLQVLEVGKAFYERDLEKGLTNLGILAIDSFMLAGVVTSSLTLITTAAALSTVAMMAFAVKSGLNSGKSDDPWRKIDAVCYGILFGTGVVVGKQIARSTLITPNVATYRVRNRRHLPVEVYDGKGHWLGTLAPGASGVYKVPCYKHNKYNQITLMDRVEGPSRYVPHEISKGETARLMMKTHNLRTLPLGGTVVVKPKGDN